MFLSLRKVGLVREKQVARQMVEEGADFTLKEMLLGTGLENR